MKLELFRHLLLWGLLFMSYISGSWVFAQEPYYRNFTVREGLPSMTVYRGFQGSDGRIWLATENGLSAFDGFEFQNWNRDSGLPDSEVTELTEDAKGRIWFSCLNGHIGFLDEDSIYSSANTDWIPRLNRVPTILGSLKDGRIAAGDPNLVFLLSPSKADTAFFGKGCTSRILLDLDEEGIWLLDSEEQLISAAKGDTRPPPLEILKGLPHNWKLYHRPGSVRCINRVDLDQLKENADLLSQAELNSDPKAPMVNHFCFGPENELWVGSYSHGLWQLKPKGVKPQRMLEEASVAGIFFDKSGNQWAMSMDKGLFFIPRWARAVRNFTQYKGLSSPEAHCMAITPTSQVLVGHDDHKLSVAGTDTSFKLARFLNRGRSRIRDLEYLKSGHLLIATDQNMMVLPPDFMEKAQTQTTLTVSPKASSPEGYKRIGPGDPYVMPVQSAIKAIEVIDSVTWVAASAGGAIKYTLQNDVVHYKYLTSIRCWALAYSQKEDLLWIGEKETLKFYQKDSLFTHPMNTELHTRIRALEHDDQGTLWVATSGQGLFRVTGNTWEHFGSEEGLPSLNCTSLAIESPTQLWVGTDVGLVRLQMNSSEPARVNQLSTIGYERGLLNSYINDLALVKGELWAASAEGVSAFDKTMLGQSAGPPCLDIRTVMVQGKKKPLKPRFDLPHDLNSLTFHLWDPCFTSNQFEYRILEKDSLWIALTGNIADFPYLGEGGQYQLEFRSLNPQGLASQTKSVVVCIGKPYYRSIWFLLGTCGALFAGLLLLFRIRSRNTAREREQQHAFLQRLSQMRFSALKSQMNPHFLFNSLHSIQELVLSEDGEATHVYISRFAMLMRHILDHSLEDFVSIAKELEVTRLYLNLEYQRHQKRIDMRIVADEQLDTANLWMPALILQPFIENAIWHGLLPKNESPKLSVQIQGLENEVLFVIEDNGIGRQAAAMFQSKHPDSASLSTQNIAERMNILNKAFGEWAFSYEYQDLKGENGNPAGTRLEIRIPYLHQPPQPYRVV